MKTALIASLLVATSFTASAMYGDNYHEAYQETASGPDGHPNSPTCGHLKFPHPERGVMAG